MSLQYIIDGYNLIRHRAFKPSKKIKELKIALLSFIREKRLCGSPKNKIIIVFDGYSDVSNLNDFDSGISVVFAQEESADERIRKILASAKNPKDLVVVSDDREVKSFAKSYGAAYQGIEQFVNSKRSISTILELDSVKPELNYTQIYEINKEMRKKWLE